MLTSFRQDVTVATRSFLRSPAFTLVAVATLALGIGTNTAMFAVVHAVVWRPLPFADPARLVLVHESRLETRVPAYSSLANYMDWRAQATESFASLAAYTDTTFNLTGLGDPERLNATQVSADIFGLLGVQPAIGRGFLAEEDAQGGRRVTILSHTLWQRRFGGDPGAVGKVLSLNERPYLVVGVMPPGFRVPVGVDEIDLYTPIGQDDFPQMRLRDGRLIRVLGRLRPGATLTSAQAEMDTVAARLARAYPRTNEGWGALVVFLQDDVAGANSQTLLALLGAVTFVLLIACANLANLFLARSASRRREFAVRSALGAGTPRLVRQLLTESLVIGFAGGAAALVAFGWLRAAVLGLAPASIPRLDEAGLDLFSIAFALVLSIAAALMMTFGSVSAAVGATRLTGTDVRSAGSKAAGNRLRGFLVAAEIAMAVVLLTGAGLMTKSLLRLVAVDAGFDATDVVTVGLELPNEPYSNGERRAAFYGSVIDRLAGVPGIRSAAAAFPLPMGSRVAFPFSIDGRAETGRPQGAFYRTVSPAYFSTLRIPIVRGRSFTDRDRAGSPAVAVINQSMAERFWPGQDSIGQRITIVDRNDGDRATSREIVGIAADVRHLGLDRPSGPEMYTPFQQAPSPWMALIVRGRTHDVGARLASEVHAVDPRIPVENVERLEDRIARSTAPRRFTALLLGSFAAIAVALTMLGIWGVTAYTVAERRQEFGVRIALGATPRDLYLMLLRSTVSLAVAGTCVGLVAAWSLTHVLQRLLFSVEARDVQTFALAAVALPVFAALASYVPARRATRVDPIVALRTE